MYNYELDVNLGQQCHIVQRVFNKAYVLLSLLRIGSVIHLQ